MDSTLPKESVPGERKIDPFPPPPKDPSTWSAAFTSKANDPNLLPPLIEPFTQAEEPALSRRSLAREKRSGRLTILGIVLALLFVGLTIALVVLARD